MADQQPSEGARRSRRGYRYQDLVTLRDCLEMVEGAWDAVVPEGDDDIVCERLDPPVILYRQVKTIENAPKLWSAADITRPEDKDRPETSILGRLFTAKPLPDHATFCLAVNEGVAPELLGLSTGATDDRSNAEEALIPRLSALEPPDDRSSSWCVERLSIERLEHSTDALEDRLVRRVAKVASSRGFKLLDEEAEQVFASLMDAIEFAARSVTPTRLEREEFASMLVEAAQRVSDATEISQGPQAPKLSEKLRAAQLDDVQIQRAQEIRSDYARLYRGALPEERRRLKALSDEVFMACTELRARRTTGGIAPGADLYAETVSRVTTVASAQATRSAPQEPATLFGILHDITARCQHRYD